MALVGIAATAVLLSFDPSLLKVSVAICSEGFSTSSLVASFVAVLTAIISRGLETSLGAFFVVLGAGSASFPCLLRSAPSAFGSFLPVRMPLYWMRGSSRTSGFSLGPSASLGLVEGPCVIVPSSVNLFVGGSLSANRSDLGQRSGKMGRGNIPGSCLGEEIGRAHV